MLNKSSLLQLTEHRPYPLTGKNWIYYQEWHDVVLAHWKIPAEKLRALIPESLTLDLYEGEAWISLTAFTVKKLRPRFIPPFPPLSNFHEINTRTYVVHKNKPGIYFLSVEAQKKISVWLSRTITGIPYVKSQMNRAGHFIQSTSDNAQYVFKASFVPGQITPKIFLDKWLTERYCVYNTKQNQLYSYDIHHAEWPLQNASLRITDMHYQLGDFRMEKGLADRIHFAKELKVLIWPRQML